MSKKKKIATPTAWTTAQIEADAREAQKAFNVRRNKQVQEELSSLTKELNPKNMAAVEVALACMEECLGSKFDAEVCRAKLVGLMTGKDAKRRQDALRYLAYPPISNDDLEALAEIPSFTKKTIEAAPPTEAEKKKEDQTPVPVDKEAAKRVLKVIHESMDGCRYPWLHEPKKYAASNMKATLEEVRRFAINSTALMMSSQQTQTARRSDEKKDLEADVEKILIANGYALIPKVALPTAVELNDKLKRGQFMRECTFYGENGDFVICLKDGRALFIECKASNSEINSRKRLNKEVVKNVGEWRKALGDSMLGACAIRGVFKPGYVEEAQDSGVFIFWHHRLADLDTFLKKVAASAQ